MQEVPYIKKLQAAAAQYFKRGDKRTAIDVSTCSLRCFCLCVHATSTTVPTPLLQVLEYYGDLNQQYKNYLFFDLLQIEKGLQGRA
jgi:hypothetical protein